MQPSSNPPQSQRPAFSIFLYRWRWLLSALMVALTVSAFNAGIGRLNRFSSSVAGLGGDELAAENAAPMVFDPSMDLWFGEEDTAVQTWYEIEDRFVAEDYVMVTLEESEHEFGVFSRESLATIQRLTAEVLKVPGVRHVRSLTYNPWIRWGTIEDELGSEEGLIISDLVETDPLLLTDEQIVERMVAILGARRVADKLGEVRVREVLGAQANFADHLGEPLLLGTILNEAGDTSVIQVQILRPRVDPARLAQAFGEDEAATHLAPTLYSVATQRESLDGLERILRIEKGLATQSAHYPGLLASVEAMEAGEAKEVARFRLADPRFNVVAGSDGVSLPKYDEYRQDGNQFINLLTGELAPAEFEPKALSHFTYQMGGSPLFERNFEEVGMADAKYIPLMFLVISLMLFLVFRNVAGVVVPLVVVFGSIMAMVGANFAKGDLMNNLTMMAPNMLTAVGIADAIHLVAAWAALRPRYDNKRDLIIEVLSRNALPVFLTSLTTAVGFYSLTVSHLVPVRMLGVMASFGSLVAYLLSMSLVPALLSIVPHKAVAESGPSRMAEFFSVDRSARFVRGVLAHRGKVLVATALLLATSIVGVARVEIDSDFRGMFPDSNPTMSAFRWIESRMGGVGDLELVFSGPIAPDDASAVLPLTREEEEIYSVLQLRQFGATDHPAEFKALSTEEKAQWSKLKLQQEAWDARRIGISPVFLETLGAFEQRLRQEMAEPGSKLSVVTDFVSPLDTLRKINQVQSENLAAAYRVPHESDVPAEVREPELYYDEWTEEWNLIPGQTGVNLVAQYYLQYESGARPGESLTTQLSADRTHFRMQGRIEQAKSGVQLEAIMRIQEIAREEFPSIAGDLAEPNSEYGSVADLTLSGKTMLFARTTGLFSRGFLESMSLALLAITILIGIVFKSIRLAIISLIPNLLPIMLPLSAFGLLGIPLDGPSILVSSVALGVCVDDTIHFFTKYVRGRRKGKAPEAALVNTLHESGAAMTVTTVVLVIGFGTLLLSDFSPNFQMGALAGVMIALAWLFDFVVTTAVLSFAGSYAVKHPSNVKEASPTEHEIVLA
ncbi:MAG: putative RND superfamily exporter protein [Candidatus Paceibacteria bacterium]|jgi:predicted RND superfamily exporter protein